MIWFICVNNLHTLGVSFSGSDSGETFTWTGLFLYSRQFPVWTVSSDSFEAACWTLWSSALWCKFCLIPCQRTRGVDLQEKYINSAPSPTDVVSAVTVLVSYVDTMPCNKPAVCNGIGILIWILTLFSWSLVCGASDMVLLHARWWEPG